MKKFVSFLIMVLISVVCNAQLNHELLTTFAVFPIAGSNSKFAEDAWWQMRDVLTQGQRFYVANKRFMVNRGAYQPKKELKPADVLILGKIIEAQALVTTYVENRKLKLNVYETTNGSKLWQSEIDFNTLTPIGDQLVRLSTSLIKSFIQDIPYHTYQILDEEIGKPVFEIKGKTFAKISRNSGQEVEVGDPVQWIQLEGDLRSPLFSSSTAVTVVAEGYIVSLDENSITVEVLKLRSLDDLFEKSLVRLPKVAQKIRNSNNETADGDSVSKVDLSYEYLSSEIKNNNEFKKDHSAASSTLFWIASLVSFILLGF